MSNAIGKEVEDWLATHWDGDNKRAVGTDIYDEKCWLEKVVCEEDEKGGGWEE